ncbi:hypothetical protein L3N51_02062 [Metallosphaera sp. J1]|uniref:hypothetical protein n=1 Tax=Metallosphaera javensis (ex Hofmann et al. 2022) TaxID=99938 RepID=UPI001EDFD893|nr:hypothetical protein [Metallosphaera javensis (ex Hofmann et al. 2022)]MCG3109766.1 hypothetical protein [Metallosphaera javensis (ex Hofmann et al. 2022)]
MTGVTREGRRCWTSSWPRRRTRRLEAFFKVVRKFNFKLVVADMVRSVDLLELSGTDAGQLCLNHVKRRLDRDEREEVDLLLSGLLAELPDRVREPVERGLLSFTSLPQELQRLLSTNNLVESFNWWRGGGSSTTRPTVFRSSGPSITTTFWIIFTRME